MQTFLPYPDFRESARTLDRLRCLNQINEADVILRALNGAKAWSNHSATRMWRGHSRALMAYRDAVLAEWLSRGYRFKHPAYGVVVCPHEEPPWLGDDAFHAAHRSNLLRKKPEHYRQFGWKEPDDLPYVWPA